MEDWILNIVLTFIIAFSLTGMLIPQILIIAFRKKLFDTHDARKIHEGIVPRLGGTAFVPAIICSVTFIIGLKSHLYPEAISSLLNADFMPLMFLICSLMLLFLTGMADDLIGVKYRGKFLFQILAAILTVSSGIYISDLCGLLGLNFYPDCVAWFLTGLIIVYCINAINLIDGIDGLAAGLVALALLFYAIILCLAGEYIYSLLAWAGLGSILPFLYYNIFGSAKRHSKIFMGDTGSLTLGMLTVFLALIVCRLNQTEITTSLRLCNPIILGFAPLIIPCFDLARVFLHRLKRRRNPFLPDRTHIHHKLLDLGLSSSGALAIILTLSIIYTCSNLWLSRYLNINILILIDVAVWIAGHIALTSAIRRRETSIGEKIYD